MNRITASVATTLAMTPFWIESLPSSGPTVRSSITFSFTGSLPEARLIASCVGALDGEVAADLRLAAEDRLVDVRRRQHLVVEDDRERLVDILLRDPAEAARAGGVEGDRRRPARPSWSKLCLASISWSPETITRRLTAIAAGAVGHRQHLAARPARGPAATCGRVGGQVDQLELEPRGLADQLLQRLGILDARHLDEDAVARPG